MLQAYGSAATNMESSAGIPRPGIPTIEKARAADEKDSAHDQPKRNPPTPTAAVAVAAAGEAAAAADFHPRQTREELAASAVRGDKDGNRQRCRRRRHSFDGVVANGASAAKPRLPPGPGKKQGGTAVSATVVTATALHGRANTAPTPLLRRNASAPTMSTATVATAAAAPSGGAAVAVAVGAATVTPLRMSLGGHNRQHPVVVSSVSSLPHAAREKIDAALPTATTTTIDGLGLCSPRSRREGAVDQGEGAEMMAIARVAVETGGVGVVGGAVDVPSMEGGEWGASPDAVDMLAEMGFGRAHAAEALRTCGGDVERAAEWLLVSCGGDGFGGEGGQGGGVATCAPRMPSPSEREGSAWGGLTDVGTGGGGGRGRGGGGGGDDVDDDLITNADATDIGQGLDLGDFWMSGTPAYGDGSGGGDGGRVGGGGGGGRGGGGRGDSGGVGVGGGSDVEGGGGFGETWGGLGVGVVGGAGGGDDGRGEGRWGAMGGEDISATADGEELVTSYEDIVGGTPADVLVLYRPAEATTSAAATSAATITNTATATTTTNTNTNETSSVIGSGGDGGGGDGCSVSASVGDGGGDGSGSGGGSRGGYGAGNGDCDEAGAARGMTVGLLTLVVRPLPSTAPASLDSGSSRGDGPLAGPLSPLSPPQSQRHAPTILLPPSPPHASSSSFVPAEAEAGVDRSSRYRSPPPTWRRKNKVGRVIASMLERRLDSGFQVFAPEAIRTNCAGEDPCGTGRCDRPVALTHERPRGRPLPKWDRPGGVAIERRPPPAPSKWGAIGNGLAQAWNCPACTFFNEDPAFRTACEVCNTPRPTSSAAAGLATADEQLHWQAELAAVGRAGEFASAEAAAAASTSLGPVSSATPPLPAAAAARANAEGDRGVGNCGPAFPPSPGGGGGARCGPPGTLPTKYNTTLDSISLGAGGPSNCSDYDGAVDGILGGVSPGGVAFPSPPPKGRLPYPTSKISAAVKGIDWEGGAEWEGLGCSSFGESPTASPRRSGLGLHAGDDSGGGGRDAGGWGDGGGGGGYGGGGGREGGGGGGDGENGGRSCDREGSAP
eukprot:jgi/Undpi1/10620/HiC_scaffold_29.g13070.m1